MKARYKYPILTCHFQEPRRYSRKLSMKVLRLFLVSILFIFSNLSILSVAQAATVNSGDCASTATSSSGVVYATTSTDCYLGFTATGSNTWTPPIGVTRATFLIVAGGGAGGSGAWGGGGGAGGVVYYENYSVNNSSPLNLSVGAGGTPGTASSNPSVNRSTSGNPSWINSDSTIVAKGGGAGASYAYGSSGNDLQGDPIQNGKSGGSGGGGTEFGSGSIGGSSNQNSISGALVYGFAGGGYNSSIPCCSGGGGGGAGGIGSANLSAQTGGAGGPGINTYSSLLNQFTPALGVSGFIAGGGGGGGNYGSGDPSFSQAQGGSGGGGNGGWASARNGAAGAANTGGGGGGASYNSWIQGSSGGSGLIIIKFTKPSTTVNCSTSGTFTIVSNQVTTNSSCTGTATIPSGVTSIGTDAFKDAAGVTAISLPSSLTTIGDYAFKATAITTLTIPNSVTTIGANAFFGTQINSLSLGTGLLTIGARAFSEMYPNPVDVTIPDSVTSLGDSAFEQSRLGSVVIGSGITTIPSQAFYNNYGVGVSSLTLGSNVTTIAGASFVGLRATSLTFPASVTTIGDRAFEGSQLRTITQSNNLSSLSTSAFQGSNSLTDVTYCGSNSTIQNYTYPNSVRSLCYSVPNAPTSLSSTAGNGEVTIAFTAGSNGNSAITNYKYSTNGTTYTALSPADTTSPVTISGLTNGTSYTIYLKAVNAIGDSVASSSVSSTPVAPVEEPSCNAACQAAEAAAKAKADADAAALVAKKAADDKAKQDAADKAKKAADDKAKQDAADLAAAKERTDKAAADLAAANEKARQEQLAKDQLANQPPLTPLEEQIEQRSEAFNAFIAELPPIVPVEELALISSREDLPQYDPASEPEKNTAAQVAGFAAVSVLAAGGAATAMGGSSSSGSSGGGSSGGGGSARTASASVARREQEFSENKLLLEEIDHLSLKRKQDKVIAKIKPGPGDNSFTWQLPYTKKIEDFFFVTSRKANRFAPLMAKLFADAAYLRAMIGSLSLITFPLAILLGLRALQDVENQALPPTWIVIATIAGLGLIDAFAGFLTSFIFVAGILMAGNLTTLPEVLTVLGTTSLFFTPALVASSFRPLRRYTLNWDHRLERIGDYLIASVLTGWTLSKIIATFNVLAGVQLAIVADANKVGIAIGFFVFIRMFAEDMATYFYPRRLGTNSIELGAPGKVQQLFSLVGKSFMFLLITQSFVGLNMQLVIGTIFFAFPILVKILMGHRLPKVKYLNYVLPKGTIRLIVMTITGALCAEFSSQFFANPRDLLTWGFVILSVPGLIFSVLGLFADESHKFDWKKSNPGKLVYLAGAVVVFYLLSQIALNKNLLAIFQGLLS